MERGGGVAAVVLAGGQGTRIRSVHPGVPKPMIPVAGAPFLRWVLLHLARQGVTRAVISTGHLAPLIEAWVVGQPAPGVRLSTAREERPLGTAGGFLHAVATIEADAWDVVLVANGDSIVLADLDPLLALAAAGAVGLVGVRVQDASRFGTLDVDADGRLRAFQEKRPGAALINAGLYALPRAVVARLPRTTPASFEREVFPALIAAGAEVRVAETCAPFIDVGLPDDLARAEAFVREELRA